MPEKEAMVYGSFDLALKALSAYDQKASTGIAQTYFQRLTGRN